MKTFFFLFFLSLFIQNPMSCQLPGRLGEPTIHYAQFGDCEIYFYMNEEKSLLSQELIENVNEDMVLTLGQAAFPCPTREIMVQAIKYPDKDLAGTEILKNYAEKIHRIAEHQLGIEMKGLSWYMNLNLNWEALKIHHDHFEQEYSFMQKTGLSPSEYTLVQDLTLIDWEMGKGTIAGTMVQDGAMGDRFIICVFPKEVVGTFYTEKAYALSSKMTSIYPGQITMPPHSTIAPMDFLGGYSCGSSKGKRISTVVRGVVPNSQIDCLRKNSHAIPINKRLPKLFPNGLGAEYPNGISIRPLSDKAPQIAINGSRIIAEYQNVTIASIPIEENIYLIEHISDVFGISLENRTPNILRFIKKDSGFSKLVSKKLQPSPNSRVVLVNSSIMPDGYRYFNLAQNSTQQGAPWIQLYHLEPGMAMEVPFEVFQSLLLSPIEELIYRNEITDAKDSKYSKMIKKITTQIDCFIYED